MHLQLATILTWFALVHFDGQLAERTALNPLQHLLCCHSVAGQFERQTKPMTIQQCNIRSRYAQQEHQVLASAFLMKRSSPVGQLNVICLQFK